MLGDLKFEFAPSDLITRMEANRDKHSQEFQTALKGYWLEVQEQAEQASKDARKAAKTAGEVAAGAAEPDRLSLHWSAAPTKPENHTGDYDRVIDMLKLAKNAAIELDEQQFAQYVRDEWDWKALFTATSSVYNSKFGDRLS